MDTTISVTIIITYLVIMVGLSIYASKKVDMNTTAGYLLAGKSMHFFLMAVMVTGAAVGGASTVGVAQNAFTKGLSAGWYNMSWVFGVLAFIPLVTRIRRMRIDSVTDIFEIVFGSGDALVAIIVQIGLMVAINATQIIAGASIIIALMPDLLSYQAALMVSSTIFIITSFFGGYLGASIANIVNVIMIYAGLTLAVIRGIDMYGGIQSISAALPEGDHWFHFFSGTGGIIIIGWILAMVFNLPANQVMYQAVMAAKSDKHARIGLVLAAVLITPIGFFSSYLGIIAVGAFPNIDSILALPMVLASLGPITTGICLAGLWAADVSTAVSLLLGTSTIITKGVVVRYIKPDLSEIHQVWLSKVVLVLTCGIGLIMAMQITSIIDFLIQLITMYVPFTIVILAIMFWPKLVRKNSSRVTVLAGFSVIIGWVFFPSFHIVPSIIWILVPVCIIAFLLTAIIDKRNVEIEALYRC
ncbi:MAG: sodium:solute symporter family protein [Tissierellia bacterium]|nr:sodium:solute symporter family protein [Tissierellia bacterium]